MYVLIEKHKYLFIWILSIFGALTPLPYLQYKGAFSPNTPFYLLILMSVLQASVLYGVMCFISYKLIPRMSLSVFPHISWREQWLTGVVVGLILGLGIYLVDHYIFRTVFVIHAMPLWAGLLASIYGAINEEVLCRLFLLPLLFFTMLMFFQKHEHRRNTLFWVANFFVAIAFGASHLPNLYTLLQQPTALDIVRIFILNGMAGLVFGWLFWVRGIWVVMIAHFVTDMILHGNVLGFLP